MNNSVELEVNNYIGTIFLNHQPLNVLTGDFLEEISRKVDEVQRDRQIRVLLVKSKSKKAFIAGADISSFPEINREIGQELVDTGKKVFNKIEQLDVPVIAVIDGVALGGGLELALACDLRIASSSSKLGLPETGLGVFPGYGGTQRLPRYVGLGKAKEMIFTGSTLSAEDAEKIGLVEHVAQSSEDLDTLSHSLALKISEKAPLAISKSKQVINSGYDLSLAEGQRLETKLFGDIAESDDLKEGVQAFNEKRSANFKGE
ncbi:enoyl-CoA hydratase/isomerase family protein [Halalkalibacillus halophilus]|uniref:enoyl-CoA hydratase/isomerase family protein n=1 Tax=Halalkalibacillus halophilus TaxID=392827 RepID=UPI00041D31FE|nr:enoyl-CoA hydratase-related protein [Halalkalibacillus halophilus]